MGLRDLVNKGKCLIGLHEGEWRAASPTDCTYTRRCVRCAAEHSRVEHPWGDWRFVAAGACEQQRACPRCDMHEQRILHSYGNATFVTDTSCDRREECQRCHDRRPVAAQHDMSHWRFVADDDCAQVQQCGRCGADGTTSRTTHAWTDWQHSAARNGVVRVCRRCGELQVRQAPETVTVIAPAPDTAGAAQAACDPRLVAHWRNTDIMTSGGFSLVTDTHLVLQADGRAMRWTHSASGMGQQTSERQVGRWRTEAGVFYSQLDGGSEGAIRYSLDGATLFFPDGGSQKLWERVR